MKTRYTRIKARTRRVKGNNDHKTWQIVNLDNQSTIHYRIVDEHIINQMPESTETFVERGVFRSFVNRMRKFVKSGT